MAHAIAGILSHIREMTAFLNPSEDSYSRFGVDKAPRYISWSAENRSQLIRIPAAVGEYRRAELRSPDPMCNPYLAYGLLIHAGLGGIASQLPLPDACDRNLYTAPPEITGAYLSLPENRTEARKTAAASPFLRAILPDAILTEYTHP